MSTAVDGTWGDGSPGLSLAEQSRLAQQQTLIYATELRQLYHRERLLRFTLEARIQELDAANRDLAALHAVVDGALSTLELDELLDRLLGSTGRALDADAGAILVLDDDGLRFRAEAVWGAPGERRERMSVPANMGIGARVLQERRSIEIAEASGDPTLAHLLVGVEGVWSMLAAPLWVDGQTVGAVLVGWRRRRELPAAASIVEAVAERAAVAIEHAGLHQTVTRQRAALAGANRALAALQQSMRVVASTGSLDEVLGTILDACAEGLGCRYAALWLLHGAQARLVFSPQTYDEVRRRRGDVSRLPSILVQVLDAGENLTVQAFLDRRPRLTASFHDLVRPYLSVSSAAGIQETLGIATVAALPLLADGRCLGVLAVATAREYAAVEADLPKLALFAGQAATAIEYARLSQELHDREQQISLLLKATIDAQEDERERICLEIHDGVAQTLAPAFQYLQALENRPWLEESVRANVRKASALVRDAIREAREVIATLRPAALDTLGLVATLRHELEALREQTGQEIDFEADPARFPKAVETALYRIIHEAVNNVKKHARARHVVVRVKQQQDHILAEIQDDGVGFDVDGLDQQIRRKGVGLLSMRKRAELLQGSFDVTSRLGHGTEVRVVVPLPAWNGAPGR